jgi:hypothetical protein
MNTSPVDSLPRDVRIEPKTGDIVSKTNAKGRIRRRTVIAVQDNYVHYWDSKKPLPKVCWITTWQEWCRGAAVEKAV